MTSLPTISAFVSRHPRLAALFGFCILINGVVLWLFSFCIPEQVSNAPIVPIADQQMLLVAPEKTPESQEAYTQAIERAAVATDTITLTTGCTMSPLVVRLPANSILKVHNTDTVEHTIAFEDQNFFNVGAGQTREINIMTTFGKGADIYRYKCNDMSLETNVGVFYITP